MTPTRSAFLKRSLFAGAVLLSLAAMLALNTGPAASASQASAAVGSVSADGPVLEVVIDAIPAGGDAEKVRNAAMALSAAIAKLPGHSRTESATVAGEPAALLRASVWGGVLDAEAASLALDGSPEASALLQSVDAAKRTVSHFRRVRESVYSNDATGHLEVVIFRTRPGTTRDANTALFDKAEAEFASGEGLLAHSLWLGPDGRWVHLLRWRSGADYEKTGKVLFGKPGVGGWIRSLDFKRFVVTRGDTIGVSWK